MSLGSGLTPINLPLVFTWASNEYKDKIECHFLKDIPLMHSCTETNTFVLGTNVIRGNDDDWILKENNTLDFLLDIRELNDSPLPFGQIMFFSYYEAGEFIMESATNKYNAHRAVLAFESFGYKGASFIANYVRVSEADKFKLMLKYGY